MGKSLDFVKQRIASGKCNGMENNKYDSMIEQNALDMFKRFGFFRDDVMSRTKKYTTEDMKSSFTVTFIYDPDADFEYFTMERCNCDGTFIFFNELIGRCIDKIANLKTYNIRKDIPEDLDGYSIIYTVGDFVLAEEFGNEFVTEEKLWMQSRFTVMLPIKFEIKKEKIIE